ncbi:MAG: hypothetical protein NVSMB1_23130 [Polyangiales bacterium]
MKILRPPALQAQRSRNQSILPKKSPRPTTIFGGIRAGISPFSFALTVLAACTPVQTVQSKDVATNAMSMKVNVISTAEGATFVAELHVGNHLSRDVAKLTSGDQLVLHTDGAADRVLGEREGGTYRGTYYYAEVANTVSKVSVDFTRTAGASALNNQFVIPPPFTVKTVSASPRKEALTLGWDRADGSHEMEVSASGPCIEQATKSIVGDPGAVTFAPQELKARVGHETESCKVDFAVTRHLAFPRSSFSPEFGQESHGDALQVRTASITSTP